jgi:trk system potassium uptake protein
MPVHRLQSPFQHWFRGLVAEVLVRALRYSWSSCSLSPSRWCSDMWLRLGSRDLRIVAHFVGMLVIGIGLAMVVPIVTGLALRRVGPALDFVLGMGVALAVGTLLMNAETRPEHVTHTHALAITAFGWVAAAMVAGVPLALLGRTTQLSRWGVRRRLGADVSGLTVVVDLDHMAVSSQHVAAPHAAHRRPGYRRGRPLARGGLRGGAFSLYLAEGRDERILPNVLHTARFIWFVTAVYVASGTLRSSASSRTWGCRSTGASCMPSGSLPLRSTPAGSRHSG